MKAGVRHHDFYRSLIHITRYATPGKPHFISNRYTADPSPQTVAGQARAWATPESTSHTVTIGSGARTADPNHAKTFESMALTLDRQIINFSGRQIEKITIPTPVQARAFNLLGSPVPVRIT